MALTTKNSATPRCAIGTLTCALTGWYDSLGSEYSQGANATAFALANHGSIRNNAAEMRSKFLAHVRLLRLPNVFTAIADPLAGWFLVGGGSPAWQLALLAGTSACLYTSGIVFNDCFDYRLDCREHPERPLPSGAISLRAASTLGAALMMVGLGLAMLAGAVAFGIASFIAAMVFFYNAWAKRFTLLGPLALGTCRFANFLLGMRCCPPRLWIAPATLGVYVTVLAVIAQRTAMRVTVKRLMLGVIVIDAAAVAVVRGDWVGVLLVLSLLVPAIVLRKTTGMT